MRNLCSDLSNRCDPHRSKNQQGRHQICGGLSDLSLVSNVLPGRRHHHYTGKIDTRYRLVGLIMNTDIKKYHLISAVLVFVVLPVMLFNLGDFPRRTFLKESISMLTVVAFSLMLGQFFLARSNNYLTRAFRFSRVLSVHKFIGYSVVGIFLLHPFLIVLPRFSEAGVSPFDALMTMLTTFESLGIVLGLVSWCLMLLIGATSLFRDKLNISYRSWKLFHGILSILFIISASWHAIELGRHTDTIISIFIILLALTGSILLIKQYALTFNI